MRRGSRRSFGSSSGIGLDARGRTGFADRLQCSVGAASAGWAARWAARRGEAIGVEPRAWPRCSKAAIAVAMQPPLAEIDESSSLLAMIRIEVSESHISQTTLQSRVVSVESKRCAGAGRLAERVGRLQKVGQNRGFRKKCTNSYVYK